MYTATIPQNKILPDTTKVLKAMRSADLDGLDRDTRELMYYLMRAITASPALKNLIRLRRVGVTSFDWEITSSDEAIQEQTKQAEIMCRQAIKLILKYHSDTPAYGMLAHEIEWVYEDNLHKPRFAKRYLPVEILWNSDPEKLLLMPEGDIDRKTSINPENRANFILDTDDSDNPGGLLRSVLLKVILAKDMEVEWANYNKKVKGLIYAKISEASTEEEKTAVDTALRTLATNNYGMFSDLTEFDFKDVVSSIGAQSFKDFIEKLESDISKAIVGQANTTELPDSGGSRAALQILKMISADITFDDMTRCESMINEQLLKPWWQKNYKMTDDIPIKFRFVIPEDNDIEARASIIATLKDAGIPLLAKEVYNSLGFTKPDDVPDIMFAENQPTGGGDGFNNA